MKKFLLLIVALLFFSLNVDAQQPDSLSSYSLAELDSIYNTLKKPQEQLSYSLAMLQKGEKELDTQDTAYAKLLYYAGFNLLSFKNDISKADEYLHKALTIQELKHPESNACAKMLNAVALLYINQSQFPKAESAYLKAMQIQKKIFGEEHPNYAQTLYSLGNLYIRRKDYKQAEVNLVKSLKIREATLGKQHESYALSLLALGILYRNMSKYEQAEQFFLEAIEIQKATIGNKHTDYAGSINSLGNLYFSTGKYAKAEALYLEVLGIHKEVSGNKHSGYIATVNNLGALYWKMSEYSKAEKFFLEALTLRRETLGEKNIQYANVVNNLGLLYNDMGDTEMAERFYLKALDIYKEVLGDKGLDYLETLNNLANFYLASGDYIRAEKIHLKVLETRKEVLGEKDKSYAESLHNIGNLYEITNKLAQSENFYLQALHIYEEVFGKEHPRCAEILLNLGNLSLLLGSSDQAEQFYLKGLDIQKKILGERSLAYALTLNNLGILYKEMNYYAKSEQASLQALSIRKELVGEKHRDYAQTLSNLGALYKKMGVYDKAEQFQLQALDIQKEILGEKHLEYAISLGNLAILYCDLKNYTKSEQYYIQTLKIQAVLLGTKHYEYALTLEGLGNMHSAAGNYAKSDSFYALAFQVKNQNISDNFTWLTERGRNAYWQKGKGFYEVLNNYAAETANVFPKATGLAYNSNLISKGLLLESAKEVEDAVIASKDSLTGQIFKVLKEKRRLINHLVSSGGGKKEIIDRYEAEADSLDKILVGRLGEYANSKRKFQISWQEVQNTLAENEAAIEFARYYNKQDSQHYYMALLLRKGYELPKLIKLGSEKAIAAIPAGKGFADLYKLLWEPIDSLLQDVKTIYYSPDGVLNNIAFAALCSQGTEKVINTKDIKRGNVGKTATEISNCTYLSERYTLHRLSMTRYLAEGLKESQTEASLLVFGGVNYDEIPSGGDTLAAVEYMDFEDYALADNISRNSNSQSKMEYLPGTQTEMQNLQKIMSKKQWKVRAYSDKNASENTLKSELQKEVPSVLHIATHGFAFPDIVEKKNENKTYRDADNPMARCGLLLAGANHSWTGKPQEVLSKTGEDGILTALEVSNLPLRKTKLVVLSACETGLGKIQGTEGVFGLQRGFKLAGVEQIIVSLWSVPDKETMELMDIFYNDLSKTRNAVTSFEKAQKDMRKKYPKRPDLCAGFVLVR